MIFFLLLLGAILLLSFVIILNKQNSHRKINSAESAVQSKSFAIPVLSPKLFKELNDKALHEKIMDSITARLLANPEELNIEIIQRAETFDRLYIVANLFDVHISSGGLIVLCDKFGMPLCAELAAAMECFDAKEHLRVLNEITPYFSQIKESESNVPDSYKSVIVNFDRQFRTLAPLCTYALNFARKNAELYCK